MPNRANQLTQVTVDGSLQAATTPTLCPGWKNTICFGVFPESGAELCRPCESGKEMWLSIETETNFGVCACLPKPLQGWETHKENLISIVILLVLYMLFFTTFGRRVRRRVY